MSVVEGELAFTDVHLMVVMCDAGVQVVRLIGHCCYEVVRCFTG